MCLKQKAEKHFRYPPVKWHKLSIKQHMFSINHFTLSPTKHIIFAKKPNKQKKLTSHGRPKHLSNSITVGGRGNHYLSWMSVYISVKIVGKNYLLEESSLKNYCPPNTCHADEACLLPASELSLDSFFPPRFFLLVHCV